jgi:rhodanese-related sulfurtransferase
MDMKVASTIAYERAHNALLQEADEAEFVRRVTASLGPQPPNFEAIVAVNRGPLQARRVGVDPLTARQVEEARSEGLLIVDVRTDVQFDDAHIPGAVCNPAVRAGFGTKLAWIADRERPTVFVGRDDDDAIRAAHLAGAVGIAALGGYLAGGMTSWREDKRPTARVQRIDVHALHEYGGEVQVLDVRETAEFERGHIPGSIHIPYHELRERPGQLDLEEPIAAICSSGQRSALAASLLLRHGAKDALHVADGGVGTWERAGWPIAST